jgi:type I restriction enzyme, S subunit
MGSWASVRLGELLKSVSRPERLEATRIYKLLGARWYAAGMFHKATKPGSAIQASTLYRIEEGDFVYSRLFAWKGSFAIASSADDGCFVSNEFPSFHPDPARLHPTFLRYYFSQEHVWLEALGLSSGSTPTSRNRLKESQLLAMNITLPPLEEQQRIVARVETLATKIEEARGLRQGSLDNADRLLVAMAHRDDLTENQKLEQGWRSVVIGDFITQVQDRHVVDPSQSYPNLGIYSFGRGLFLKPPIEGTNTSAQALYRVKSGQFIYSRLFAFEGSYGIVTDEFDGRFVSNEYPTFECDPDRAKPEFLLAYLKSPRIWPLMAMGSKGLGDRRQRIQPEQILAHRIMLPPLEWQTKIAAAFDVLNRLKTQQEATTPELEALLPSILSRAFAGEL